MPSREVYERKVCESLEHAHDYAVLSLSGAPFGFAPSALAVQRPAIPPVGRQVAYLGYPFGASQLVVSSGYVSSVDSVGTVTVLRIDGSVNKGNSGGPLFDVETRALVGIVARAETGLVRDQFEELRKALASNVDVLTNTQAVIQVGGIDPIQGIRATMIAMSMIVNQLERSANVGIGFAFSTDGLATALAS